MSDIFDFLATDHLRPQTFFGQIGSPLNNYSTLRGDNAIFGILSARRCEWYPLDLRGGLGCRTASDFLPAFRPLLSVRFVYNLCLISHPSPSLGACGERRRLGHLGDESQGRWGRMMGFRNEQYIGIFYHIICHN